MKGKLFGWGHLFPIVIVLVGKEACLADVIPANRIPSWQGNVGVDGGVANRTNIFRTLTPTNSLADINNALASCPSNQVVQLGAGTFNFKGSADQILFSKDGVTLRGSGISNTILNFTASQADFGAVLFKSPDYIFILQGTSPQFVANWTAGYAQGATNITLSSTSGLAVGNIVCLDQLNDNADVTTISWEGCDYCSRNGATRSQQQRAEVKAINGTIVTIWPPLMMPNWRTSMSPNAWSNGRYVRMCGIEDLTINGQGSTPGDGEYRANICLVNAWNCWVKNVKSLWPYGTHVNLYESSRCEVRHCDFYGCQNSASMCYGVLPMYATANLIEDNTFNHIATDIVLGSGTCGNVASYNYTTDNWYTVSTGWMDAGLFAHDAHACMNLFEGNYANGIDGDFFHGSSGYNTVFRNRLHGGADAGITDDRICVNIWMTNHYWNVVGNVLGTPGLTIYYAGDYPQPEYQDRAVYHIGYQNLAEGAGSAAADPLTVSTLYRHGNYDVVTGGIVWNSTNADHNIPASLYLAGKPSWFGNRPWPAFDPANINAGAIDRTNLPAGYRFVYGVDPPSGGLANQPPVANASASSTNGPAPLVVSFSSAGSSDPEGATLTYSWAFGDGGLSTAANPSHTYTSAGTYTAQLSVSDGTNTTSSTPITIRATIPGTNQPPVVAVSATATSGVAPLTVAFSSAGSYDPEGATLTYNWIFGDGATSTAANPSHVYAAGTFAARVQVSDGTNTTSSNPLTITVTNPAPVVLLTSPTNGASYAAPATINFAASVTPIGHTITKVQFYNGAALLGEDTAAPYALSWTNVGAGSYSLTARAVYDAGATSDSSAVTVGVGGLVAAYGFEEGSGATTSDSSGTGNNGTISSAAWTSSGKFGDALSFNGTSSLVTVNDSPSLDLTTGLTLEAWVYPTALGGWKAILFKPQGTQGLSYVLQGSSGASGVPSLGLSVASSNLLAPNPLLLNTWSHLAATYDGTTMLLYVNGVQVASQAQTGVVTASGDPLTIGGNSNGEDFAGNIDEVRIYSRALSASEIQSDMNRPVSLRPLPPTGLRVVAGP